MSLAAFPVEIEETDYAKVDSYGVGFAPYFMSISLWVGGLIALVMLYNDPEDKFKLLSLVHLLLILALDLV